MAPECIAPLSHALIMAFIFLVLVSVLAFFMQSAIMASFFIPSAFAEAINGIFVTHAGHIISLPMLIKSAWAGLFGTFVRQTGRMRGRCKV